MKRSMLAVILSVVALLATMFLSTNSARAQSDEGRSKLLTRFPEADLDKDGKLSEDELQALKKTFRKNKGDSATRPTKDEKEATRRAKLRVPITYTDVAYGPHERNTLDFWKAESSAPAPVMVLIHAGGFTGGDKSFWYSHPLLGFCHEHGISVASINYPLIRSDPYPAPMHDAARAVQFLRLKAAEWNIDPTRIGTAGGSAGACIAVWLATHDDLADTSSSDPISRQSTRISLAVAYDAQTCLDPVVNVAINAGSQGHPWYRMLFGASSAEELSSDRIRKLIDDASAVNHVTKDDPPIYMNFQMDRTPTPLPRGQQNMHHPQFGVMLQEKMTEAGLESVLHYKSKPPEPEEDFKFIMKHLGLAK